MSDKIRRDASAAVLLCLAIGLGTGSRATARGDERPVVVPNTLVTNDGRPSNPSVVLKSDAVRDIDIRVKVQRPDGTIVGKDKQAGRSVVAEGNPAFAGAVAARAGNTIEFAEARSEALPDGLYVEHISLEVVVEGVDYPVQLVELRHFEVSKGRVAPLTSTEYSNRTANLDTEGNPRMGPVVAGPRPTQHTHAVQIHSGDTKQAGKP